MSSSVKRYAATLYVGILSHLVLYKQLQQFVCVPVGEGSKRNAARNGAEMLISLEYIGTALSTLALYGRAANVNLITFQSWESWEEK